MIIKDYYKNTVVLFPQEKEKSHNEEGIRNLKVDSRFIHEASKKVKELHPEYKLQYQIDGGLCNYGKNWCVKLVYG